MVAFERVSLAFDDLEVLRDVSFTLERGRMMILLGASGSGKSVVLKLILGLLKPDAGAVYVMGQRVDRMNEPQLRVVRGNIGMLFQESALFDSLTVADNVGYRLAEELHRPDDEVRRRVSDVLRFIGMEEYLDRQPSELSGGQRRRVAIARAMAAKPPLLLFDEPVSGLDPITAMSVDAEIIKLRDLEGVTSIVVTHQLRDAFYIATHTASRDQAGRVTFDEALLEPDEEPQFLMLKDGGIAFSGPAGALRASPDPYLRQFIADEAAAGWMQ
jgi:phospholipid/cholesterol/gamma-HCH transport system ATP-binding protein